MRRPLLYWEVSGNRKWMSTDADWRDFALTRQKLLPGNRRPNSIDLFLKPDPFWAGDFYSAMNGDELQIVIEGEACPQLLESQDAPVDAIYNRITAKGEMK